MDTIYPRMSRRSASRQHRFGRLLGIAVVFISSVSLGSAGGREKAEFKSRFAPRASALSHYGPVSGGYLDGRSGGPPIYTQDFVEYYVPYQSRCYRTPAGDYRQVTFADKVVVESQPVSSGAGR